LSSSRGIFGPSLQFSQKKHFEYCINIVSEYTLFESRKKEAVMVRRVIVVLLVVVLIQVYDFAQGGERTAQAERRGRREMKTNPKGITDEPEY
jgi:hypothetical protein